MEIYVKKIFLVFNHDFIIHIHFTRIAASNTVVPGTVVVSRRRRLLMSQTDTSC